MLGPPALTARSLSAALLRLHVSAPGWLGFLGLLFPRRQHRGLRVSTGAMSHRGYLYCAFFAYIVRHLHRFVYIQKYMYILYAKIFVCECAFMFLMSMDICLCVLCFLRGWAPCWSTLAYVHLAVPLKNSLRCYQVAPLFAGHWAVHSLPSCRLGGVSAVDKPKPAMHKQTIVLDFGSIYPSICWIAFSRQLQDCSSPSHEWGQHILLFGRWLSLRDWRGGVMVDYLKYIITLSTAPTWTTCAWQKKTLSDTAKSPGNEMVI